MTINGQKGSVLIYILIAVALFAALSMAVSSMMRGGGNIGTEKSGIFASEVLTYGGSLRSAVQNLKISNGCEETQISFERSPFDASDPLYVNPSAPSDFSCHVFHPEGGGANYQENFEGHNWRFTAEFNVDEIGTVSPELTATLIVPQAVCEIINTRVEVSNTDVQAHTTVTDGANGSNVLPAFQGTYSGSSQIAAAPYVGKTAGCYLSSNSDGDDFTFYQILIPR